MAEPRHLNNAPIREGLIDIQFEATVAVDALGKFAASLRDEFGQVAKLWQQSFGIGIELTPDGSSTGPATQSPKAAIGFRLETEKHVLVLRAGGFTLSKLAPYKNWDELRTYARSLWEKFVADVKPGPVTRIAVRYINELRLPAAMKDFSEFLEAPPIVPGKLPQDLSAFLQRMVIVDAEQNRRAIVTQALEEVQASPDTVSMFLDIDTFRHQHFEANDADIWASLDNLRNFKNDIFFGYITEEAAELFQ